MKASEIDKILVRYYDGVTDEAEEKELKRFFTEEDVPAHLLAQKEIFMQLGDFSEPEIPDGLECRLSAKIDEWAICEKRTLKVNRTGQTGTMGRKHSCRFVYLVLCWDMPIQTLFLHDARYLCYFRRSVRTGSKGTRHAFCLP